MPAKNADKAAVSSDTAAASSQVTGGPADADAVIAPVEAVPPTGSTYIRNPDVPADTVAQLEVRS